LRNEQQQDGVNSADVLETWDQKADA